MKRLTILFFLLIWGLAACSENGAPQKKTAPVVPHPPTRRPSPVSQTTPVPPADASATPFVTVPTAAITSTAADIAVYTLFSVNVQDFSYPEESAAVLDRLISLHEEYNVPVDIYLTDQMAQIFADQYPALMERLKTSPVVAISYHTRSPRPYASQNDWLGVGNMDADQLHQVILDYETHAVDPVTGQTIDAPGGYQNVATLIGYSPYVASALSGNPDVTAAVVQVFSELGAQMTVSHGRKYQLGDTVFGMPVRPEQAEYKLFEHVGEDAVPAFETVLAEALAAGQRNTPAFVGIKIHDNNFFATQSAWVTVYVQGAKRPDWDPALKAPLLSQEEQDAIWQLYQQTVAYVAQQSELIKPVNIPIVLQMLTEK